MTTAPDLENEPLPASPAARPCPNCGRDVPRGGRGLGRTFCQPKCQAKWNARNKARGSVLAPMILAFRAAYPGGSRKPDERTREIVKIAKREFEAMVRTFLQEDRDAGRPTLIEWAHDILVERGSRYMDRRRK